MLSPAHEKRFLLSVLLEYLMISTGETLLTRLNLQKDKSVQCVLMIHQSLLTMNFWRPIENPLARLKLKKPMQSKSLSHSDFRLDDMVQDFAKCGHQKRERRSCPLQVIKIDHEAGVLFVQGAAGQTLSVTFEYACAAHVKRHNNVVIQQSIE